MSTYYYAIKTDGDYIFDNFPKNLRNLVTNYSDSQKIIEVIIDDKVLKARLGSKSNSYGTLFTLTTDDKFIRRYKLFKDLLEMSIISIESLSSFQNDLVARHNSENQEFIHNVTSLNTYSIQDLFALIPQKILTENFTKQNDVVKQIIAEKPKVATKTLLKLIKYSLATKVEFSVFERTMKIHSISQKIEYSIRILVLSILQIFMEDFEEREITVYLDACEKRISVDHDSLFVSLYYIFDNAIKYCHPKTDFKIIFKEEQDSFSILFVMISIRIEQNEIEKLFTRGYRSENVKQLNAGGNGIGMYRILKTLKFNDAILVVTPRINSYKREFNGLVYEGNEFKIKFMGQQDWFKTNFT
ncbi:ATP-binding protein [Ferruginibacter sp. HRS2-29]|uniref:ATP-binding protein n=1 Tax=Ferruginibacter sp. HRS2-29 TaxID=2487334 RepID=UPI0020CDE527|nr:ATP-binding protein [Ferruginibacter sp. HRS2-29]MCP9750702.1 sensor histidine kinase [Ferruginibacter sp. HRS2-29]